MFQFENFTLTNIRYGISLGSQEVQFAIVDDDIIKECSGSVKAYSNVKAQTFSEYRFFLLQKKASLCQNRGNLAKMKLNSGCC